jgi:hypothetical protein
MDNSQSRNISLKRWQIIAVYWYTAPSQYCPWFYNTSQREFPINHNVDQLQYTINKPAGPGKAGYQLSIRLWPMVEHAKKVFWHQCTLHQQLSLENSLAGTKNYTQLLQYLHTKEPSMLRASHCRYRCVGKELLHGILWLRQIKMYWR